MYTRFLRTGILVATSSTFLMLPMVNRVRAQIAEPLLVEQIEMPVGAVLEVMALHTVEQPQFAWSLQRQQTFLQASRARIFRSRLIEPGLYTLEAHVRDNEGTIVARKQFQITVGPSQGEDTPDAANSGSILLRTDPARDENGRIVLRAGTDIVRLVPHSARTDTLFMDTDATVDTDGDGNLRNDQSTEGTFFATEHTPLYLWLPTGLQQRTIVLADTQHTEELQLITANIAQQIAEEERIASERILAEQRSDGSIAFRIRDGAIDSDGPPLLFEWSFGDGSQSLLTTPVHTYTTAGRYDVQVSVRNLQTGAIQETLRAEVSVLQTAPSPPILPDEPAEPADDTDETSDTTGMTLLRYWPVFIVLLLSILAGFGIMLLIRFIQTRGGLQGALNKAESTLTSSSQTVDTGRSEQTATELPPAPLTLLEEEGTEETTEVVGERTEETTEEKQTPAAAQPPAPTPQPMQPKQESTDDKTAAKDAHGPDWLQQGLQKAAATGQDMHSPPPAILQEDAPPADVLPPPDQEEPPDLLQRDRDAPQEIDTTDTNLPPWLQQQPAVQEPAATTPADDRAAERKRLKRKRYQQNKKARENAEKNPAVQQKVPAPQTPSPDNNVVREEAPPPAPSTQQDSEQSALPEQKEQPIPPLENAEGDENVKFIIGADSINEANESPDGKKL